jgi:Zn-finger in Ran binding protein and others/Kelch motif
VVHNQSMIVFGGNFQSCCTDSDTYAFDFATSTWSCLETKGTSPDARCKHIAYINGADSADPEMIVFGGWDQEEGFSDAHALHLKSFAWRTINLSPPDCRIWPTVATVGNTAYLFGGEDAKLNLRNELFIVSSAHEKLQPLPSECSLPADRYGHASAIVHGYMLIYGGYAGEMSILNDLHAFDFVSSVWGKLHPANAPAASFGHSVVVYDNAIFVFGGTTGEFAKLDKVYKLSFGSTATALNEALANPQEPVESWTCGVCTLINDADASMCIACTSPRP